MNHQKITAKIIRQLCRALANINMLKQTQDQRKTARALEGQILGMFAPLEKVPEELAGEVISTGAPKLLKAVEEKCARVQLSPNHWRRLLKVCTPKDVIRLMNSQTIAQAGFGIPVLGAIASGEEQWEKFLFKATAAAPSSEHKILLPKYRGLLTSPKVANTAASFLRAQIERFPADYAELAKSMTNANDAYGPLLMMLAGINPEDLTGISYQPDPDQNPTQAFFRSLKNSSAHQQMEIRMIAPSLEVAIRNAEKVNDLLTFRINNQ